MKRLALLIAATALVDCSQDMKQTNLLFIMHDDLRPQLNNYGLDYMITPNYDRLAQKSVVFDYAFCQVAVCNPSRDSLLTGLRPDVLGTYNFQHSFAPHILLPVQLVRSGYNTAMFGKMLHWPNGDPAIWNFEHWENDWYKYQNMERNSMNSSTMPDKIKPEEEFRDALFTNRAIKSLRAMAEQPKPFMLAVGFKLPHLELHVPYKYYEMYKDKSSSWKLSSKERRFPTTANHVSYRCCAEPKFSYMREEGAIKSNKSLALGDINAIIPTEVRNQLMAGYCAGITFVDKQLGRILDALDELDLWKNTTVVLTSDHGMHNGEKGLW